MRLLPDGSDHENDRQLNYRDPRWPDVVPTPPASAGGAEEQVARSFNFRQLLRRYWILAIVLLVVGAAAGFASVVLSSPRYKTRLLLEVQSSSGSLSKNDGGGGGGETSDVAIQTQVTLLRSGSFLAKGAERMAADAVPMAAPGKDIFSRLRQRIHPATQDPIEAGKIALQMALNSFDARAINKTRLIELTCESTSPEVASQFLNAMADEFVQSNNSARMRNAQKTSEWLSAQIDDAKSRVTDAETKLQEFSQAHGNLFAGQDATLDDTKLQHLKVELSGSQSDRIKKETRYEQVLKSSPESLAEVLDDAVLRGYKVQLEGLKRDKAQLEVTYTPKHEKVRKIEAQIEALQKSYETEINNTTKRIKSDYDAAVKQEQLLNKAYNQQAQRVGSEAGTAATYQAYRRDVETQRQLYATLMAEQSQVNMSSSVPVDPILIAERPTPPEAPYKPQPIVNISFGTLLGLACTGGLVFLRERADRSIKEPGISRRMFNAPELGVIPNLATNGNGLPKRIQAGRNQDDSDAIAGGSAVVASNGQSGPRLVTESFRSTLASILRNQASGRPQKMILVSSPGPAEGKTTVVQNLGIVLAETGRRVLLVDADFRRPHLHHKFGLPNEWSLMDILCEDRPIEEYLPEQLDVPTGIPGLSIIPNRVTHSNVAKALYSPRLRTILETFRKRYDMILVDAPPILSIADARIIAPLTDGLILVLRCGVTDREAAMAAYQRIQEDGLGLLGTVLTDYDTSADRKRQYYYDYGDVSRT